MGRLVEAVGAVWRQLRPWRQLEGLRAAVRMGASAVGHEVAGLLRSRGRGHDELSGHIESVVLLFCSLGALFVSWNCCRVGCCRGATSEASRGMRLNGGGWRWMEVDVSCIVQS